MSQAVSGPSLNEIFTIDPVAQQQNDQFWNTVWKVAQYATIATFILSSTVGFVFTSLYYPSQVLAVTLSIYTLGLYYTTQLVNYLTEKADSYQSSAIAQGKIIRQLNLIHDDAIPSLVKDLDVNPSETLSKHELKLGMAQFLSLKQEQEELLAKKFALNAKFVTEQSSQNVEDLDFQNDLALDDYDRAQDVRITLHHLESRAALTNVLAAHTLKLLNCPAEKRSLDGFCQVNPLHAAPLLIAKAHGDKTTNVLLKTSTKNFTVQEILKKDASKLASEIFELPKKRRYWSFL